MTPESLIGKNEAQVLALLGSPSKTSRIKTARLNPSKHTAEEIIEWKSKSVRRKYEFGDLTVEINEYGVVIRAYRGSSGDTDRKNALQDQPKDDDSASDAPAPENGD